MQLPVDAKKLVDEMTDIDAARATELSLSVYVDDRAPADLVALIRGSFASTLPTVRMTLSYLDDSFVPHPTDDMAIVIAGASPQVGPAAAAVRAVGVPVMVATTMPTEVGRIAEEGGYAIPDGDIVAPFGAGGVEAPDGAVEPFALDDAARVALQDRMGKWVVAVCRDKRLALAIAFPFMRRALAKDAVQATSLQNAGIGLVPLIPGADLPIMTLNQAKMVLQIAAAYGYEMDKSRIKELLPVVGGAYVCRALSRQLLELVPFLGFVIRPSVAYGGTAAMGYAIIEYFEGGQDVAGVAAAASHVGDWGGKAVSSVRDNAKRVVPVVSSKVSKYAPAVERIASSLMAGDGFPEGNLLAPAEKASN